MGAVAAPLVAAAGNVAGGAAASAVMGDTSYPKGGGINGLTSADTGKSGVSPAVQIDPTTALQYFQQAANQYESKATQGLDYYNKSVSSAINTIGTSVQMANSQLSNIASMGSSAQNEYLKMLGLNTTSPTANFSSQVGNLGPQYGTVAKQMAAAEKIKDPTQRQAALDNILTQFNTINTSNYNNMVGQAAIQYNQQVSGLQAPTRQSVIASDPNLQQMQANVNKPIPGVRSGGGGGGAAQRVAWTQAQFDGAVTEAYNKAMQDYQAKVGQVTQNYQQAVSGADAFKNQVGGIYNDYSKNYSTDANYFGYGGDEIAQRIQDANPWLGEYKNQTNALIGKENQLIGKIGQQADALVNKFQGQLIPDLVKPTAETLANTPGYKFSLQQGQEAVLAAAAKGGMLSSGNTLAAMDKYSQGLAQQVYQQEYANYLNSVGVNNTLLGNVGITQNNANTLISGIYGNQAQQQSALASASSTAGNNYMTNLYNAMTQGNNAIAQQATNTLNGGTNIANLQQGQGAAALQTYQGIGQALYNSTTNQGNTWNQDMLENMKAQNAMIMQSNQLSTSAGIAANQNATSNGYLQVQQLNTLNNIANQTGQAQGFRSAAGGGSYRDSFGNSFTNYTLG